MSASVESAGGERSIEQLRSADGQGCSSFRNGHALQYAIVLDKHLLGLGVGTIQYLSEFSARSSATRQSSVSMVAAGLRRGTIARLGHRQGLRRALHAYGNDAWLRRKSPYHSLRTPPVRSASTWPRLPCCGMDTPSIMESLASLMESLASLSATHLERKVLEHVREARLGLEPAAGLYDD